MSRGLDMRFALIEDAADMLKMLPAPAEIAWPSDPGDIDAAEKALRYMTATLPGVRASLRAHKRALRDAITVRG
jgi:hypothetical protein